MQFMQDNNSPHVFSLFFVSTFQITAKQDPHYWSGAGWPPGGQKKKVDGWPASGLLKIQVIGCTFACLPKNGAKVSLLKHFLVSRKKKKQYKCSSAVLWRDFFPLFQPNRSNRWNFEGLSWKKHRSGNALEQKLETPHLIRIGNI